MRRFVGFVRECAGKFGKRFISEVDVRFNRPAWAVRASLAV